MGFGCNVLIFDKKKNEKLEKEINVKYVDLDELLRNSDIITLHCHLVKETKHPINKDTISKMKDGVMLINTSRGLVVDTSAVIDAIKSGKIGSFALDVYEEETLFFYDYSREVIKDDVLTRLITFPNVLITAHQGFFTKEALENIKELKENKTCKSDLTKH